jgi:hypothetical protein
MRMDDFCIKICLQWELLEVDWRRMLFGGILSPDVG